VNASCWTGSVAIGGIPLDDVVLVALLDPPWTTLNPEEATGVMRRMYWPASTAGV